MGSIIWDKSCLDETLFDNDIIDATKMVSRCDQFSGSRTNRTKTVNFIMVIAQELSHS